MKSCVLALDQGTTGIRAVLYNSQARKIGWAYQEFRQHYPQPGWVEHHPEEIWKITLKVIKQSIRAAKILPSQIRAIGITNQRETVVLWDKKSGRPVYPAIVWQDRRTAEWLRVLRRKPGLEREVRKKTGLVLDPYFSASKIHWILRHVPQARKKALQGKLLFGTIDTWILWKLTRGASHATDMTNASRTLLFNIRTKKWDSKLLKCFGVPASLLPKVQESSSHFGETSIDGLLPEKVPILAVMGDQQAALYGQACYTKGQTKNTYGTGCFVVTHAGERYRPPPYGLLTTLACSRQGKPVYAVEGSIFIGGAVIQWLRDGLGFFRSAEETEKLAKRVKDNGGVTLIPAFVGLGSPYWNPHVRGIISGLTRGTKKEHIIRAALESIAQQTADVLSRMKQVCGTSLKELKVDGGATANRYLMQFQADLLGLPVHVSRLQESTVWGAAKMAGVSAGIFPPLKKIDQRQKYSRYIPKMNFSRRACLRRRWEEAVAALLDSPGQRAGD